MTKQNINTLRPLGQVSDVVQQVLPQKIHELQNGTLGETLFQEFLAELLSSKEIHFFCNQLNDPVWCKPQLGLWKRFTMRDLALLDLKYLDAAHYALFNKRSSFVSPMVDLISAKLGRPPILTYEELVMINPLEDMRLFLFDESHRENEYLFYMLHGKMEHEFVYIIDVLSGVRRRLQNGAAPSSSDLISIKLLRHHFGIIFSLGRVFQKDFNKEGFAVFRPFISSYYSFDGEKRKDVEFYGPSGAYSASVPIVELTLGGDYSTKTYLDDVSNKTLYFPVWQRAQLSKLLRVDQRSESLLSLSERYRTLHAEVNSLCLLLQKFRMMHMGLVKRKLPEVFEATGGHDTPESYLQERIDNTPGVN